MQQTNTMAVYTFKCQIIGNHTEHQNIPARRSHMHARTTHRRQRWTGTARGASQGTSETHAEHRTKTKPCDISMGPWEQKPRGNKHFRFVTTPPSHPCAALYMSDQISTQDPSSLSKQLVCTASSPFCLRLPLAASGNG